MQRHRTNVYVDWQLVGQVVGLAVIAAVFIVAAVLYFNSGQWLS